MFLSWSDTVTDFTEPLPSIFAYTVSSFVGFAEVLVADSPVSDDVSFEAFFSAVFFSDAFVSELVFAVSLFSAPANPISVTVTFPFSGA